MQAGAAPAKRMHISWRRDEGVASPNHSVHNKVILTEHALTSFFFDVSGLARIAISIVLPLAVTAQRQLAGYNAWLDARTSVSLALERVDVEYGEREPGQEFRVFRHDPDIRFPILADIRRSFWDVPFSA